MLLSRRVINVAKLTAKHLDNLVVVLAWVKVVVELDARGFDAAAVVDKGEETIEFEAEGLLRYCLGSAEAVSHENNHREHHHFVLLLHNLQTS